MMVLAFDPLLVRVTTKHETIKQFYLTAVNAWF
jgi:hypothetical protein